MSDLSIHELEVEIEKLLIAITAEKVKARMYIAAIKPKLARVDSLLIAFLSSFVITLLFPKLGKLNNLKFFDKINKVITHPLYKIATAPVLTKLL